MQISSFRVAQMDCRAEEQLVRMSLDGVDDVDAVSVDLDQRTVTVRHAAGVDDISAALDALNLGTTQIAGDSGSIVFSRETEANERRVLVIALAINAVLFVAEFAFGLISRSMGLVADSLDMLADASIYALSLIAVGGSVFRKKRLAAASAYLQLGLATVGLVEVARRFFSSDTLPDARMMILVSLVALAGNVVTLLVLRRAKSPEAHFQASWIFTANDIKINTLVIVSAIVVAVTNNPTADLVAGAAVFVIVGNGARRILKLAR